jgi:16S rRNA C1402 (ribose-2'-O) methylase RsmI
VQGTVYLIPVTLGGDDFQNVIPENVLAVTRRLRNFVVEDLRSARRYLRLIDRKFPIDETIFFVLNEHTAEAEISRFLKPVGEGHDIGIMSEAGLPGIADPGSALIRLAHRKNIRVVPLSGPSSIILALISTGRTLHLTVTFPSGRKREFQSSGNLRKKLIQDMPRYSWKRHTGVRKWPKVYWRPVRVRLCCASLPI